jgi:hypothetical protein
MVLKSAKRDMGFDSVIKQKCSQLRESRNVQWQRMSKEAVQYMKKSKGAPVYGLRFKPLASLPTNQPPIRVRYDR